MCFLAIQAERYTCKAIEFIYMENSSTNNRRVSHTICQNNVQKNILVSPVNHQQTAIVDRAELLSDFITHVIQ